MSKRSFQEFNRVSWAAQSLALSIPFIAILHNAVFYRGTCLLNLISDESHDYNWGALVRLFQKDPSSWIGIGLALGVFIAGLVIKHPLIRMWVPVFLVSTLPIVLWIWDVPFAGQPICHCCHDLRWVLPVIGAVRSRTIYSVCITLFAIITLARVLALRSRSKAGAAAPV